MNKLVIGLTGGIGAGKTTAANGLAALGCGIVDADVLSRGVTGAGGAAEPALRRLFPSVYVSGTLDRAALKRLVFSDPDKLKKLNAAVWPHIEALVPQRIAQNDKSVVILVAPLLFESGLQKYTHAVVTVSRPRAERINAVRIRDNINAEQADLIASAQLSDLAREALSDAVVTNDCSLDEFLQRVRAAYEDIIKKLGAGK
ncbi:MAG: dephospho-CoA kinase [Clostridiales bacterium]|jgi:dephospho-CoA kinase|nr:dephospho-CoA kinase [Clostridiales bacterium]